ncbi:MAG: hypothetical protein NZ750_10585 [Anaerolineae bacterium]|nr:hypothetical protein [Anaerolineae bacterium]MDW8173860.1 hypothetical protein [Anaerolineae bacterium]
MTPAWRIWRVLSNPPRDHPLYRFSQRRPSAERAGRSVRLSLLLLALALLILGWQPLALIYGLLGLVFGLPLSFFVLGGTLIGAWIAAQTASQVAHWRARSAALVGATPLGVDGLAWIIGLAQANAHQLRATSWRYARWLSGALALLVLFIQASAALDPGFASVQERLWVDTLAYLSLTLLLLLDHAYGPVNGLLIGLLVGLRPGLVLKPSVSAVLAFLTWQGLMTLGLGLAWLTPLRSFVAQAGLALGQQALIDNAALLLIFTTWREMLVALLLWAFRRSTRR